MTPVNASQIEFSFKYLLINMLDNFFFKKIHAKNFYLCSFFYF